MVEKLASQRIHYNLNNILFKINYYNRCVYWVLLLYIFKFVKRTPWATTFVFLFWTLLVSLPKLSHMHLIFDHQYESIYQLIQYFHVIFVHFFFLKILSWAADSKTRYKISATATMKSFIVASVTFYSPVLCFCDLSRNAFTSFLYYDIHPQWILKDLVVSDLKSPQAFQCWQNCFCQRKNTLALPHKISH